MSPDNDVVNLVAELLNLAYLVRMYRRGARTSIGRLERQQAIQMLGLTLRRALDVSTDFEPILKAVVDGLKPHDEQTF